MAYMEWKESFSVGLASVDKQHKKLVDLINELGSAMLKRKANEELGKIINQLFEYSQIHFSYEEDLFDQYDYPEKVEHILKHREFISKTADFKMDFESGKLMLSMKVMEFLKDWLINHINGIDKKYAPFLSEKGVN